MNAEIEADDEELAKLDEQADYLMDQRKEGRDGKLTKQLMGALKHYAGSDGTAYVLYNWDDEQGEYEKEEMIRVWEGSLRPEKKDQHDLILHISLAKPFETYDYVENRARDQIRDHIDKIRR